MPKLQLKAGTTSKSVGIFIQDSSSTTGAGLAGLVFNTASLVAYWYQPGVSAPAAITLATLAAITTAWSSGGFKEADATNMPGHYRLDIPNAVLTGATTTVVELKGAANMAPCVLEIELTAVDNQSATGFVTSVPSVVGAVGSVTGNVGGSVTGNVGGNVTGNVGGIIGVTFPANFASLSIDASGQVDLGKWLGTAVTLDANNAPNVSAKYWAGTAITATSIPVATAAGASGGLTKVGTAPFPASGTIASAVLDEVNTGATHNVTNSLGKQLRLINPNSDVIYSSTLPSQSGVTTSQVKLDTGASSANGAYVGTVFSCVAGTGQGSKVCTGYTGSTRLAVLDSAWSVAPIAGDTVEVTPSSKAQVIGYATGQDPATLVLDAAAASHVAAGTIGANIGAAGALDAAAVWTYTTRTLTGLAV